ncbi:SIS domain-containing protein [Nocardioides sp. BP30]|uniref:SIS domain-containing protein n=1 Tax=Nocardioides sp. BP30 TaxID=3036374 RepID=UPI00246952CF|nr:SIS domain-containing protein [Nocardioides sp. BP30]WGL51920.1 SIS domain-containing protein [Nocardioides sp. BP30]
MNHFDETIRLLGDALRSVRDDEYEGMKADALATVAAGGKLVFSGLGKNVPICEKVVGTLNSVGIPAAFMHTNSAVHGDLGIVRDGDLVVVLSKSGETSESVHLVDLLKAQGRRCSTWLLSFSRTSTLYREVPQRLILELEHEGDAWDILPNNSTVLNLLVLQQLAMDLVSTLCVNVETLHLNHPGGAIGVRLDNARIPGPR